MTSRPRTDKNAPRSFGGSRLSQIFSRGSTRRRKAVRRQLQVECLEGRRLLTLPPTKTSAGPQIVAFNGPTVDTLHRDVQVGQTNAFNFFYFAPQFTGTYVINAVEVDLAIDPEVAIYRASDGLRVGYNDDESIFNDNAELIVQLLSTERYIIGTADRPNTASGVITVTVTAPGRSLDTTIIPDTFGDVSITTQINTPTDIDYFTFTTPPDTTSRLRVYEPTSAVRGLYSLFNATGLILTQFAAGVEITVAANTTYRLAVSSINHATSGPLSFVLDIEERGAIVTNTLDAGPGSLRKAIVDANAHANIPGQAARIVFEIPGAGPYVIAPGSPLPPILYRTEIYGVNNVTGLRQMISLDGSALTGSGDGLQIRADDSYITKLAVRNFPGDGIEVVGNRITLINNYIGTDLSGVQALGNDGYGIVVQGGSDNSVLGNLVSGNGLGGIAVVGDTADNNRLASNRVGVQLAGGLPLPNQGNGISIADGDANTLEQNLVSGNSLAGVLITGTATTNTLIGNKIGTDLAGLVAVPNLGDGIVIRSPRNKIGGNRPSLSNLISGNGRSGLVLTGTGASNNVVEGNYIGTDLGGTAGIPNAQDGIRVINAARNRIGSTTEAAAGNLISGNGGAGISLSQTGVTGSLIYGNLIGTTASGLSALGNSGAGVLLFSGATNVQIGGTNAISRNVISANGASGVSITNSANNNRVSRNQIGLSLSGDSLGNTNAAIQLQGPNNTIGGANSTLSNTIGGSAHGILITGSAATNNTIAFNKIGTSAAPNTLRGITVSGGASNNTIGPKNTITRNATGMRIENGSLGIRVTENSFIENVGLGIDLLGQVGVNVNDAGDADTGANRLQNYPIIVGSPQLVGNDLELSFRVNTSPVHAAYPLTIEFFTSDGDGEGSKFLGSTLYTEAQFAAGVKTINFAGAGIGLTPNVTRIVGTATDFAGNSSEFSPLSLLIASALQQSVAMAASNPSLETEAHSAIPQAPNVFDVNGDKRLTELDVLMVLNGIADSSRTSTMSTRGYLDVDSDGQVSLNDAWLVIRGIQITKLNVRSVTAINQSTPNQLWDTSLLEVIAHDLPKVKWWMQQNQVRPID